jgi:hypothetical protein
MACKFGISQEEDACAGAARKIGLKNQFRFSNTSTSTSTLANSVPTVVTTQPSAWPSAGQNITWENEITDLQPGRETLTLGSQIEVLAPVMTQDVVEQNLPPDVERFLNDYGFSRHDATGTSQSAGVGEE